MPVNRLRRRNTENSESDTPIKPSTINQKCGGFAGAIGPEKAHHLAWLNLKRNVLHRHHFAGASPDEMAQGAGETGLLLGNPVNLAEPFDLDQNGGQNNISTLRENSTQDRSFIKGIDLTILIEIGTLNTAMTQE